MEVTLREIAIGAQIDGEIDDEMMAYAEKKKAEFFADEVLPKQASLFVLGFFPEGDIEWSLGVIANPECDPVDLQMVLAGIRVIVQGAMRDE